MKKIILYSLMGVLVLAGVLVFTSFKNTKEDNDYIIVRTIESTNHVGGVLLSKILVLDGTKVVRSVDLEIIRTKNYETNIVAITTVLSKFKGKGYKLVSSNSSCVQKLSITDYIFEK